MAKAKKLPSGNWRVQVYAGKDESGKKIMKSFTAPTKRQAEAEAAMYLVAKKESENSEITVGQAIDSYISAKENVLSPVTIRCYRKYREKWLQGLMDIPVSELNVMLVQNEINQEARHLSPKSLRNAYGLLSAAVRMHCPSMILNVTLPSREHKIKELPEPREVIQAIQGTDVELPCLLALWLSLRMSEVRGIKYSDICGNVLTIHRTIVTFDGHHIEKNQTKTYNSTRQHVLPERILELIRQQRESADCDEDYVITSCGQTISKKFIRLLEKNHVKRMTFHELRHLNASVMLQLGVPDKYAMERGGWSTNETLKTVYQHTFTEKRQEIDRQINRYFDSIYDEISHEISHDS
ncbi:MAG: site-specific integrase [Oscillospiraceae bacterium]|nr:site-specific integrase [Oscillospiraceae bacterium]